MTNFIYWPYPRVAIFDEKKVSKKGSKHIWVDSVFNGDSKYVKKSIGCHASFQKSSLFFKDPLQSQLRDCAPKNFLLVKRCLFALVVERQKPQVSILFLPKVIQKTVTRTDFLDGHYNKNCALLENFTIILLIVAV